MTEAAEARTRQTARKAPRGREPRLGLAREEIQQDTERLPGAERAVLIFSRYILNQKGYRPDLPQWFMGDHCIIPADKFNQWERSLLRNKPYFVTVAQLNNTKKNALWSDGAAAEKHE